MGLLARKVAHNTIYQVVGKMISVVLGVLTFGILARYLGASGFGDYTTITTFSLFATTISDMGLYLVLARDLGKPGANESAIFSNALTLRLLFGIFFSLLTPIVAWPFHYSPIVWVGMIVVAGSTLFSTLTQITVAVFQKHLRTDLVAIGEIIGRVVLLGIVLATVYWHLSLVVIIAALGISSVANFAYNAYKAHQFVPFSLRLDRAVWRKIMREAWPVAVGVLFIVIYNRFSTIYLSIVKPAEEVGVLGIATKINDILYTFPAVLIGLLIPILSRFYHAQRDKFVQTYQRSFDALLAIALPIAIGTQFFAKEIVVLLGGAEFAAAELVLRLTIIALLFGFLNYLPYNTLAVVGRQRIAMVSSAIAATLTVIAVLLLVPTYGARGAAITICLSEIIQAVITYIAVAFVAKVRPRGRAMVRVVVSTIVMAGVIYLLRDYNAVIVAGIALVVYSVILLGLKTFSKEEILDIIKVRNAHGN